MHQAFEGAYVWATKNERYRTPPASSENCGKISGKMLVGEEK
jgi:hypothetical protein